MTGSVLVLRPTNRFDNQLGRVHDFDVVRVVTEGVCSPTLVRSFKYENGQASDSMSSSVDVSDRTRRRLERLRAAIEVETGREVSQREVLDRIVGQQYDSKEELVTSFCDKADTDSDNDWQGLSEEEVDRFFAGTSDWGFETSEEEIDEILYGK